MSVELQLLAIASLVIFAYKKNTRLGLYINLLLLTLGTGYLFFIFYSSDILPQGVIPPDLEWVLNFYRQNWRERRAPNKKVNLFLLFDRTKFHSAFFERLDEYHIRSGSHLWSFMYTLLGVAIVSLKINQRNIEVTLGCWQIAWFKNSIHILFNTLGQS